MAKISIFNVLNQRKKFRIFTGLATLLVLTFLAQFLLIQNPFDAKAGVQTNVNMNGVDCDYAINGNEDFADNTTYDNSDLCVPVGATLKISGVHNFHDVTIEGTLIMAGGPHTFNNLTVKNSGNVTHDDILDTDIDTAFNNDRLNAGYLRDSGDIKKVNIIVTNSIKLENGGKFDVSGKGFPGGPAGQNNGYGPGYGRWAYTYDEDGRGGSGAGHGADGGYGYSNKNVNTIPDTHQVEPGHRYGDMNNPTLPGSGGGGSRRDSHERNSKGGDGGGVISITTNSLFIDATSGIFANGETGGEALSDGGGGSGGSIIVEANTLYSRTNFKQIQAFGEHDPAPDFDGIINGKGIDVPVIFDHLDNINMTWITANGGLGWDNAGSGSGGRMFIDIQNVKEICRLVSGDSIDYIPASCDVGNPSYNEANGDVVIDNKFIVADNLAVWQETGAHYVCPKSHFRDINNDGVQDRLNFLHQAGDVAPPNFGKCEYWAPTVNNSLFYLDPVSEDHSSGDDCVNLPSGNNIAYLNTGYNAGDGFGDTTHPGVSARYSTCDTKRHFKSITVRNNAEVTHNAPSYNEASSGGADLSIADSTSGTGRWRKVFFVVDEEIILKDGGKINVDGKGYPGGRSDGTLAEKGYGPGGGVYASNYDGVQSGGGGYGGNGGNNADTFYPKPASAYKANSFIENQFDFGSGGGGVTVLDETTGYGSGSSGGGRVYLRANKFRLLSSNSLISANGINSGRTKSHDCWTCSLVGTCCDDDWGFAGAGAGGTIRIEAADYEFFSDPTSAYPVRYNGGTLGGGTGYYKTVMLDVVPVALKSMGGNNDYGASNGGGGGRIVVRKIIDSTPTISKILSPVSRVGLTNPDQFNPYAVQYDDIIKVTLRISNIQQGVDVKDSWLKTVGTNSAICKPNFDKTNYPASVAPLGDNYDSDPLVWTSISADQEITYYCKVSR